MAQKGFLESIRFLLTFVDFLHGLGWIRERKLVFVLVHDAGSNESAARRRGGSMAARMTCRTLCCPTVSQVGHGLLTAAGFPARVWRGRSPGACKTKVFAENG